MVLYEEMYRHVVETCALFVAKFVHLLRRICRKLSPFFKFGGVVEVAQIAEHGVWTEPFLVFLIESLVFRLLEETAVVVVVDGLVEPRLCPHHFLVVYFVEFVEFLFHFEKDVFGHLARKFWHLADTQVDGMQRKYRNAIVRIRILPRVGEYGVIDGQELYHTESNRLSPVDERNQVHKFAYAKIVVAPQ